MFEGPVPRLFGRRVGTCSLLPRQKPTDFWTLGRHRRAGAARLLGPRLLVAGRLLRGLKLLHSLLQACYRAFERHNLGGGLVQLMSRLERILDHEPLQKVHVALKASRSLV